MNDRPSEDELEANAPNDDEDVDENMTPPSTPPGLPEDSQDSPGLTVVPDLDEVPDGSQ